MLLNIFQIFIQNIIGISASVFTAIASVPQLLKIIKEKKAEDISILMIIILLTGLSLWIYYGILKEDLILIVANAFSFILNASVLTFAVIFKKHSSK